MSTTSGARQHNPNGWMRPWTSEARRERSLQLADERGGGMWAVHFVEAECDHFTQELVTLTVEVDSAREEGVRYTVVYDARTDEACCTCRAGQHGAPCHHAGKAILYGRMAADAYSPAGRAAAEREWTLELNAAAIAPSL